MQTLLQKILLSSTALLCRYAEGKWPDIKECERLCFIRARGHDYGLPDHVYKNAWDKAFHGCDTLRETLFTALEGLAQQHLVVEGGEVRVRNDALGSWQDVLPFVPPLPVLAFAIYQKYKVRGLDCAEAGAAIACLAKTALPSVRDPGLDDLARHVGLRDLHVHLNGSTEADWIWQDALKRPTQFARSVVAVLGKKGSAELFLQLDESLEPGDLYDLLNIAACIRDLLATSLHRQPLPPPFDTISNPRRAFTLRGPWRDYRQVRRTHPYSRLVPHIRPASDLCHEARLLMHLYAALEAGQRLDLAPLLHYYLLVHSYLNQLLVQQCQQKGFEQFDKITANGMRDFSEHSYFHRRFDQMEGMYGEDLVHLEGRFAPKDNGAKLRRLLKTIQREYKRYKQGLDRHAPRLSEGAGSRRMTLSLVGHFIKKEPKKNDCCQHYALRRSLEKQARLLALACANQKWDAQITGCDGAGNELHAPPEVFAPAFRRMRFSGLRNFTYHAGEDFTHLLGGIRAVYEAIVFLDLGPGDRVGHATALGISPQLWRDRMGPEVAVRRPHALDDLVFAWSLLREEQGQLPMISKLEREILRLAPKVYRNMPTPPVHILEEAWRLRARDPLKAVVDSRRGEAAFLPFDREEWNAIAQAKEKSPEAFTLFERHHGKDIYDLAWGKPNVGDNPFESVPTDIISMEAMELLQHAVLRLVNERSIALEAMLTSNVRISCYANYDQHHIFTWLNLDNIPGYPAPAVCICSDDPGIFATTTRNEYAHVLDVLRRKYGRSQQEALRILNELLETSRRYGFQKTAKGQLSVTQKAERSSAKG